MVKGVMGKQISYMTLIGVHLTMHANTAKQPLSRIDTSGNLKLGPHKICHNCGRKYY